MKTIALTQGKVALVDDEDYGNISSVKWCFGSGGYAIRNAGKLGRIRMHWEVAGNPAAGYVTDHINGNCLDNRRCNLRHVRQSENVKNRSKQINNTSGYKGVYLFKATGKWHAEIKADGVKIRLGAFVEKEDAAKAYDAASIKYHGDFSRPNLIIYETALSAAQLQAMTT